MPPASSAIIVPAQTSYNGGDDGVREGLNIEKSSERGTDPFPAADLPVHVQLTRSDRAKVLEGRKRNSSVSQVLPRRRRGFVEREGQRTYDGSTAHRPHPSAHGLSLSLTHESLERPQLGTHHSGRSIASPCAYETSRTGGQREQDEQRNTRDAHSTPINAWLRAVKLGGGETRGSLVVKLKYAPWPFAAE